MPLEGSSRDRLVRIVGVGLWLIALVGAGMPRALGRHFHVDEAQTAYDTALLGVHGRPDLATGTAPVLVAAQDDVAGQAVPQPRSRGPPNLPT